MSRRSVPVKSPIADVAPFTSDGTSQRRRAQLGRQAPDRKVSIFGTGIFTNANAANAGVGAAGGLATFRNSEFHELLKQLQQAHETEIENLHRAITRGYVEARTMVQEAQRQTRSIRESSKRVSTETSRNSGISTWSARSTKSTASKFGKTKSLTQRLKSMVGKRKASKRMAESPEPQSHLRLTEPAEETRRTSPSPEPRPPRQLESSGKTSCPPSMVQLPPKRITPPPKPGEESPPELLPAWTAHCQFTTEQVDSRASLQSLAESTRESARSIEPTELCAPKPPEERPSFTFRMMRDSLQSTGTVLVSGAPMDEDMSSDPRSEEDEPLRGIDNDLQATGYLAECNNGAIHEEDLRQRDASQKATEEASSYVLASMCACGNRFAPDASFCRMCGKDRPEVALACACDNDFLPDATFCRKCGRKRPEKHDRRCTAAETCAKRGADDHDSDEEDVFDDRCTNSLHQPLTANHYPLLPALCNTAHKTGGILKRNGTTEGSSVSTTSTLWTHPRTCTIASVQFDMEVTQSLDEREADDLDRKHSHSEQFTVFPVFIPTEEEEEEIAAYDAKRHNNRNAQPAGARPMLLQQVTKTLSTAVGRRGSRNFSQMLSLQSKADDLDGHPQQTRTMRCCHPRSFVGHPHSNFNFGWDCGCILLILWDIVMLPMMVFDMKRDIFTDVMACLTASFWTMDLFHNFFVGYYQNGNVNLVFVDIAWNYLKTWLCPDVLLIVLDWTILGMRYNDADEESRINKIMRAVRYIRMLRLLRAIKANRLMKVMQDRIHSEYTSVIFTMGKHFCCILVLNHMLACAWYGVGSASVDIRANWVETFIVGNSEDSLGFKYTTSFHWALMHFINSSINVQPVNVLERIFEIIALLFALIVGATFLSSMTSAVMHLSSLSGHKTKQFWLLRRYLRECKIPTPLAIRIHNFCEHAWDNQSHGTVDECQVLTLQMLSSPLRTELRMAIYQPRLEQNPLFVLLGKVSQAFVRKICSEAVSRTIMGKGELLFAEGEWCSQVIAPQFGVLSYHQFHWDTPPLVVPEHHWLCEAALWTDWMLRGECLTETLAEAVAINHHTFREILAKDTIARFEATLYAKKFVQGLNRTDPSKLTDMYEGGQHEGLWFRLAQEYSHQRSRVQRRWDNDMTVEEEED